MTDAERLELYKKLQSLQGEVVRLEITGIDVIVGKLNEYDKGYFSVFSQVFPDSNWHFSLVEVKTVYEFSHQIVIH